MGRSKRDSQTDVWFTEMMEFGDEETRKALHIYVRAAYREIFIPSSTTPLMVLQGGSRSRHCTLGELGALLTEPQSKTSDRKVNHLAHCRSCRKTFSQMVRSRSK